MTKKISCYICGTWTNKKRNLYICPKCKAKFKIIENNGKEEIVRYYENYAEYVED